MLGVVSSSAVTNEGKSHATLGAAVPYRAKVAARFSRYSVQSSTIRMLSSAVDPGPRCPHPPWSTACPSRPDRGMLSDSILTRARFADHRPPAAGGRTPSNRLPAHTRQKAEPAGRGGQRQCLLAASVRSRFLSATCHPPVLFKPMRWQPHTTPLWSPDPAVSRVLPYEKIFAELAWSRSKPYQDCINVRHRTDKPQSSAGFSTAIPSHNSETGTAIRRKPRAAPGKLGFVRVVNKQTRVQEFAGRSLVMLL